VTLNRCSRRPPRSTSIGTTRQPSGATMATGPVSPERATSWRRRQMVPGISPALGRDPTGGGCVRIGDGVRRAAAHPARRTAAAAPAAAGPRLSGRP
jgi:hypothetical protein